MSAEVEADPNAQGENGKPSENAPVAGRRKMVKPKMDFAKALSIMGFSTSRTLDPSGGHDAKVELNAALSRKMADIEKRKRAANKKEQTKVEDKLRDEIRTLHEAYQFLSKKYIKLAETMLQAKEEAMLEQLSKEEKERKARAAAAKKASNTKMSISDMMFEEDFDEEYEYEDFYNDDPNDSRSMSERRKSAVLKRKKQLEEEALLNNPSIAESTDSTELNEEENANDDEVFENVEEMEVSLCQLINDTFRLDDDDLLA